MLKLPIYNSVNIAHLRSLYSFQNLAVLNENSSTKSNTFSEKTKQ